MKLSDDYGRVGKGNNEDLDIKLHTHDVEFNGGRGTNKNINDKLEKKTEKSKQLNYKK